MKAQPDLLETAATRLSDKGLTIKAELVSWLDWKSTARSSDKGMCFFGMISQSIRGDHWRLFRSMVFLCFNFGVATMGSGVTAATVSTDGAGAPAVEVDGVGFWL